LLKQQRKLDKKGEEREKRAGRKEDGDGERLPEARVYGFY
jgi:hypothetical protein